MFDVVDISFCSGGFLVWRPPPCAQVFWFAKARTEAGLSLHIAGQ